MFDYLIIFKFSILVILLSCLMVGLAMVFGLFYTNNSIEKNSAYECGFETFSLNPIIKNFEIEFLLIALLFLIFDLELIFLIPWVVNFTFIGIMGYLFILFFLFILLFGFLIEYLRGFMQVTKIIKKNEM